MGEVGPGEIHRFKIQAGQVQIAQVCAPKTHAMKPETQLGGVLTEVPERTV